MKALITLLKRDIKNSINKRLLFLLIFMILLQLWFILGSGSVEKVIKLQQIHFMSIVFSFNLFGSIIALAFSFDSISNERESKVLDLILTSNISKKKIITYKALTGLFVSAFFAVIYVLVILVVYLLGTGDLRLSLQSLYYILPITAFLFIYHLMGLSLSILLRSSRTSLIISVILGGLFIPRLYLVFAEGVVKLFGLGETAVEIAGMLSPALIMNALSGYGGNRDIMYAVIILTAYIVGMILLSMFTFLKQDELNYGE